MAEMQGRPVRTYLLKLRQDLSVDWQLYVMFLPVLANFVIFHYVPIYGLQIAFKYFNIAIGVAKSPWVGFLNFQNYFSSHYFLLTFRNTVVISLLLIVFGFPMPIVFALVLNEVGSRWFRKFSQTVSYLPHFISSVVVVGMVLQFLAGGGILNTAIERLGGKAVQFISEPRYFRPVYIVMELWRSTGFGAIIYIAAITGIDQDLYEAAKVDGAGRLRRIWHITLPSIIPTVTVLFILRMGGILNVGWLEILLLQNPLNFEVSEVISTYVYKRGLIDADYGYAAAVGFLNSLVGMVFVVGTNAIARRVSEDSLF